jgi:Flp pilus assembly protein TadD
MNSPTFATAFLASLVLSLALCGSGLAATAEELGEINRLYHAGQSVAALKRIDSYLATKPKDAQMRFLRSIVLADTGHSAEAMALLQQLAEDYPELAEPHNNLAALYASAFDYGRARTELEESIRLNPSYATAHENLGDVLVVLAGQSYAKALRLEPASASLPRKLSLIRQLSVPATTQAIKMSARELNAASAAP